MDITLGLAGLGNKPEDSGITNPGENITKVLLGIDMETPELLLAKELGADCVISHHPKAGMQILDFHRVMERQIDTMVSFGVPINKAQKALDKRKSAVDLNNHVRNYNRFETAAKLLGMPYMNIHMPADIIGERIVQTHLDKMFSGKPKTTLDEVIGALMMIPEYEKSISRPLIRVGKGSDYAGRIAVLMAGGTNGGADVFKAYFEAGVGTIICMHVPDDVREAVATQNIGNIIVAGHMASDSIGLNIIADAIEARGVEVVRGFGIE
jgi:putative NIF3 family GTP cyclohydrolase 1 type 2